jgi:hypothetical protein
MFRRLIFVASALVLVGLLVNLAYQPDVGTAADLHSAGLTDPLVGTNHAKPLPRVVTVAEVLRVLLGQLLVLVLVAQLCWVVFEDAVREDRRRRSVFRSLVRARRGPPALVAG